MPPKRQAPNCPLPIGREYSIHWSETFMLLAGFLYQSVSWCSGVSEAMPSTGKGSTIVTCEASTRKSGLFSSPASQRPIEFPADAPPHWLKYLCEKEPFVLIS